MSDDRPDDGLGEPGLAAAGGYEPPKLSIYEHEAPAQWAALREGEDPPEVALPPQPRLGSSSAIGSTTSSGVTPPWRNAPR